MSIGRDRALAAGAEWLVFQDAPEAAIAAHEAGRAESAEAARRWVRSIVDRERGGAWDDDLSATTRALLTIHELRQAAGLREQDPAIGRALDWIRTRRHAPGAWTDGCSPERHRRGFCHHFATGFFSPGPAPLPVALPSGARLDGDEEARFTLSTVALRSTLLWRPATTDDLLHLEALRRVVTVWSDDTPTGLTTTSLLAAVRALVRSERESDKTAAGAGLEIAAGRQRGDGSWVDADPFHAMAVFYDAAVAGLGGPRVDAALEYAARLVVASQRSDGSWGPEHGPRRALIALRVLRRRPSG